MLESAAWHWPTSLEALPAKYKSAVDRASLDPILDKAGVLAGLRG